MASLDPPMNGMVYVCECGRTNRQRDRLLKKFDRRKFPSTAPAPADLTRVSTQKIVTAAQKKRPLIGSSGLQGMRNNICRVFNISDKCTEYIAAWRYQKALLEEVYRLYKRGPIILHTNIILLHFVTIIFCYYFI